MLRELSAVGQDWERQQGQRQGLRQGHAGVKAGSWKALHSWGLGEGTGVWQERGLGWIHDGGLLVPDCDPDTLQTPPGWLPLTSHRGFFEASPTPQDPLSLADGGCCSWQFSFWKFAGGGGLAGWRCCQAPWSAHRWLVSDRQWNLRTSLPRPGQGPLGHPGSRHRRHGRPITREPLWLGFTKPAKYFPCHFMRC